MNINIKNIIIKGLTADTLKVIAICTMLIDHIAFYFNITNVFGIILRIIGRIAMPIFVYLLVQGFFKTKNFKKYLFRIFVCACVTQFVMTFGYILNLFKFNQYSTSIYKYGNILFSFAVSLVALRVIHEKNIFSHITHLNERQNYVIRVILLLMCCLVYYVIPIDYGIAILLLSVLFYICERLKITFLITKSSNSSCYINSKNVKSAISEFLSKTIETDTINNVYKIMVSFSVILVTIVCNLNPFTIIVLPLLLLYNGERNDKICKFVINKNLYYIFFPVHHFILYFLAMLIS